MFIRQCYRTKNGKRHAYWELVESYRTERGPRQRVVAYLGQLDEKGRLGVKEAAQGRPAHRQKKLFEEVEPQWVEVDAARVRLENRRDFGGPWLALEMVRRLRLKDFLDATIPKGQEEIPWSAMALVLVISRLCNPSSELHIAEHFYGQTAMAELLGVPACKVNEQRLYRSLDVVLPHKEALEIFLKNGLGEMFQLEYDLLLYDVTSTYFEGEATGNPRAQRGYSRDHRPDCKQVCIALVDRGMMSEKNINFLKQGKRRYIIGAPKSALKKFEHELLREDWQSIRDGLEVKLCPSSDGEETFILCRSRDRGEKEKAVHERFEKRIEEGLKKIEASCSKNKCEPVKIATRVGKLMGRNTRAAGLFHVDVKTEPDGRAKLVWRKVEAWRDWAQLSEGCYLLRSNVSDWSAEDLWKAYIQLTEAEAAFRIHKSDLRIRPIWHQKDERVLAHILVCFLAYVLWKMLGELCRAAGLGSEPRRVLAELGKITVVDVVLPTRSGVEIRRRCVTRPNDHQAILLQRLGLQLPTHLENTTM